MMPANHISLSTLLGQVRSTLEKGMEGKYWFLAEIMEMHVNARGHCYLELIEKDREGGSILARSRATIWASRFSMLRPYFEATTGSSLKSGMKVLCQGSVNFHPQFGFSLNLVDIDPSYTLGDLARKKMEVIRKLQNEGVMGMNRELPLPPVPQRVAVISSETAAGYGDFNESMQQDPRGFCLHTRLFPALMQGDDAPASIMAAMDKVHEEEASFDLLVLVRGGGSKADLECFNDYELAYYITQFPLPVITGIGHERDESVADMVAARALKTPTAVAEFLLDLLLSFEFTLSELQERLNTQVRHRVQARRLELERLGSDLGHLAKGSLLREKESLNARQVLLQKDIHSLLGRKKEYLGLLETRCKLVDPVQILRRGYTLTLSKGKVLHSASHLKKGDRMETHFHDGKVISKVEEKTPDHGKGKV